MICARPYLEVIVQAEAVAQLVELFSSMREAMGLIHSSA